jgi:hypothetical protein
VFRSKTTSTLLSTTLLALLTAPAFAQRVQFPTAAPGAVAGPPSTYAATGGAPVYNGGAPAYAQPPAAFQGGVVNAPSVDWYGNPSAQPYYQQPVQQGSNVLFPSDPVAPYGQLQPGGGIGSYTRLFNVGFDHEWLYGSGFKGFGKQTADIYATANLFFFPGQKAPFEITPGFTFNFLQGPNSVPGQGWFNAFDPSGYAELPPRAYDAYLNSAWKPQVNEWFSGDINVRVGVYSDFDSVTSDSIRIMGHGLALLSFSQQVQLAFGVVYYDRLTTQLLPAGGVIWTPNDDWRFEILFPRSKVSKRIYTMGNTDFRLYGGAEFYHDGGSWTVRRVAPPPFIGTFGDRVEYKDHRGMVGLEWQTLSGFTGYVEAGVAFSRNLKFVSTIGDAFDPDTTFFLSSGFAF